MNPRFIGLAAAAAALSTLALAQRPAAACGACFAPPGSVTTVDSHRMVIALSPNQTTLWDQIRYSGNPAEFVWVLPVPSSDTTIALANDFFFTELENQTVPVVRYGLNPPNLYCPFVGPYGGSVEDGAASADAGVTVFQESVVGPYETVTVGSDDPAALHTWLTDHGYNVPPDAEPVIAYYTAKKNVFIALRLRPGQGVSAMQPVRVTYPGFMGTFPLKMVTVGAAGALSLELFVVADQRYEASNYGTRIIDRDQLVWDWNTPGGNYDELFKSTIEAGGGKAFIAESAMSMSGLYFFTPGGGYPFIDAGGPTATVEDDVAVARTGLRSPYLTRLRTRMLVDHLADDLVLTQSADPSPISRDYVIMHELHRPKDRDQSTCPKGDVDAGVGNPNYPGNYPGSTPVGQGGACQIAGGGAARAVPMLALVGLGLVLLGRRRRR